MLCTYHDIWYFIMSIQDPIFPFVFGAITIFWIPDEYFRLPYLPIKDNFCSFTFRLNHDEATAPYVSSLLTQAREYIMTSDHATLLPVFPCLTDIDHLIWSTTGCRHLVAYSHDTNRALVQITRVLGSQDQVEEEEEDVRYALVDLDKMSVCKAYAL